MDKNELHTLCVSYNLKLDECQIASSIFTQNVKQTRTTHNHKTISRKSHDSMHLCTLIEHVYKFEYHQLTAANFALKKRHTFVFFR